MYYTLFPRTARVLIATLSRVLKYSTPQRILGTISDYATQMVTLHYCQKRKKHYPLHPPNNPSELQGEGTYVKFVFVVHYLYKSSTGGNGLLSSIALNRDCYIISFIKADFNDVKMILRENQRRDSRRNNAAAPATDVCKHSDSHSVD